MNKLFIKIFLAVFSLILIFTSCSIEKRVHMSGYHVAWQKSNRLNVSTEKLEVVDNSKDRLSLNKSVSSIVSSSLKEIDNNTSPSRIIKSHKKSFSKEQEDISLNNVCDLVVFKSGEEVEVKVLEVGVSEVKYKKCDNLNGPTFSESKKEVFMIKFSNGSKTVFSEDTAKPKQESSSFNETDNNQASSSNNNNNKSLVVAVLLWLFLGLLGIHRFYLGHVFIGILYLLTGGLCGIGWVIDGILFLVGGLRPKNGTYNG